MYLSFSADWFTPHIPLWERVLAPFKGKPNIHFLEVGSFKGRSACWLLSTILTHPSSTLTCIDFFKCWHISPSVGGCPPTVIDTSSVFDTNIAAIGATSRVRKLIGNSHIILRSFPLFAFDCIYIDASHEPRDVLRDAVLSWDLLKEQGLLIFDDYELDDLRIPDQRPKTAIDAFLSAFAQEYEEVHRAFQVVIRKTVIRDLSQAKSFVLPASCLSWQTAAQVFPRAPVGTPRTPHS